MAAVMGTKMEHLCLSKTGSIWGQKWSTYVFPKQPISKGHQIKQAYQLQATECIIMAKRVISSSVSCAIEGFLSFLQQVPRPFFLAGHNIKVFDCPLLFNALENNEKVSEYVKLINGFIDTKVLFKKQLPNLSSYSQENIYKSVTGNNYNAHDALENVSSLQLLVNTSSEIAASCEEDNSVVDLDGTIEKIIESCLEKKKVDPVEILRFAKDKVRTGRQHDYRV
ncbi:unnamed protein product [Mytilus edulis]|uniref:Exonuclease domain-containing protein n=1 Tax=Mytilus edulis TaxID=6550 RepID=A0A8S3SIE9_MYTED|nr:unnamed protein product [Mytilus edulis]